MPSTTPAEAQPGYPKDTTWSDEEYGRSPPPGDGAGFRGSAGAPSLGGTAIDLAQEIVERAVYSNASDIHCEQEESDMVIRYRVDGALVEAMRVPRGQAIGLVSRIKIMASLDIAERRMPQDGRLTIVAGGRRVDVRIVTMPTSHGESVVLRLLDAERGRAELTQLGMSDHVLQILRKAISKSHGATIVAGPTGSGKTTTLYACLSTVVGGPSSVYTVEDPVEYDMPGASQVQVSAASGLTFAKALRSMLRADPDVIMVGEIRDEDTARIAVQAAMTGHIVLTTIHTRDAPSALSRLIDMDVPAYLAASAIDLVVAQRLVRMLCPNCKRSVLLEAETLRQLGFPATMDVQGFEPAGCDRCLATGFQGRSGIYEAMPITDSIQNLVLQRAPASAIAEEAQREGMETLAEAGLGLVMSGVGSAREIARLIV